MSKDPKSATLKFVENYFSDCLAWNEDPEFYIALLRKMEEKRKRNFEDILKYTVTFIKRHGDKLSQLTDDEIRATVLELRAKFEELNKPKATAKKAVAKKLATKL